MDYNEFFRKEVNALKEKGLDWKIRVLQGKSVPHAVIDGKKSLILCSNNYLNLSSHPKLIQAGINALKSHGAGSGSVRAIAGTMDLHQKLEKKISEFKETEDSLYYQTGFAANAGLIPALMSEGDLIISDELNHGSIIDGVRLSKAEKKIFPHKNTEELKKILEESEKNYSKILVVSDGVFSMDGDIAPLDKISFLCRKFNALSYVDDAHGDGVLGKGKGIVHHFNLQGKIDIEMGTFSKAFGVVGGYITGTTSLKEFALNKSRTWLLSGSAPPATIASCIASLELVEEEPEHVKKLWDNTFYWKKNLKKAGFDSGESETPITPVMLGESITAKKFSEKLMQKGIFALPIVFPMVAQGKARIRTMMNSGLTKEDLDSALEKFEETGKELKVI
ncbi:aminotransferase class I/II-fold pyridoxal phosphate-dependent enzyme [Candidatus Micrarchaeota archaeon]|nr:aminotransferase class I/II-fold pyridoxal phosphate-dependent enzyme [Candidatus Micrarchaeota archaeon]MBU2476205.1 aminotransferase class I/II-fold pyridoxal phosphate-dependent enzyme [Candidatus Micrarchaeota archaeon]